MTAIVAALVLATLVSEDVACIAAGALIARGDLSAVAGVIACALGIFIGDCGVFAIGRFARRASPLWRRLAARADSSTAMRLSGWIRENAGGAIVASRFMPGTRLPTYFTAGLLRIAPWRFATWAFAASLLWTPVVVLASARSGEAARQLESGAPWPLIAATGSVLLLVRSARLLSATATHARVATRLARLRRWEFWPAWLLYAPVAVWVVGLAFRYRGLGVITTSNPGIRDGGVVGESKFDILQQLPAGDTIPSALLVSECPGDRLHHALGVMKTRGWTLPIVLKPDVGQRGVGVRVIRSVDQLSAYVSTVSGDVLMQPLHAGAYEAGVFYYRFPTERHGRIFSITDKHFPILVGDGHSTVAELIDAHPRYRLQHDVFLRRHRAISDAVLPAGERLQLAFAGNHAQGAIFHDGAHLATPALEEKIDAIAKTCPGFFVGRFDIRYSDVEAFKVGQDIAIVELNGATAESTNVYDPDISVVDAYRTLFRQWSLVFAIGNANRARGAVPTSNGRLFRLVLAHLTSKAVLPLAD